MHNILHQELGLVKKSARWVPKLLSEDHKKERVRICTEFVAAVHRRSMAMMDNIVMMDETMVSYHTPQTKRQSPQWITKGSPGPVKAKVAASRTK
jgi:histone-lysine N-methyltransferase SETMAR